MQRIKSFTIIFLLSVFFASYGYAQNPGKEHLEHVFMMDKTGYPCNPETRKAFTLNEYQTHIQRLLRKIETKNDWKDPNNKEIMFFIHGGLNSRKMGEENAGEIFKKMNEDNAQFPVFVVWSAGFFSSYFQHLFKVRQGEHYKTWAYPTVPFIFASDWLAAAAYYPINLAARPIVWGQRSEAFNPKWRNIDDIHKQLQADDPAIRFNLTGLRTNHYRGFQHKLGHSLVSTASIPFGNTITLAALSGPGMEAWLNLSRRTKTMFRSAYLYDPQFRLYDSDDHKSYRKITAVSDAGPRIQTSKLDDEIHRDKDGGVALFIDELVKLMDKDPALKITLVGHSMGAMITNEMLRLYKDQLRGKVSNVIFMGGASSIHDWENAVLPYLQENESARFYNLCLNPIAERNEHHLPLFTPSGTLLEWIDNFFSKPETFTDRRIGKYENFALYLPLIPNNVRSRITFTVFDYTANKKASPKTHGSFDNFNFWQPRYWQQGTAGIEYNERSKQYSK